MGQRAHLGAQPSPLKRTSQRPRGVCVCVGGVIFTSSYCFYPPAHSMALRQELGISPRPGGARARSEGSKNPALLKEIKLRQGECARA